MPGHSPGHAPHGARQPSTPVDDVQEPAGRTSRSDSTGALRQVCVCLRARLQCWRCGTTEEQLSICGELVGDQGVVPLYACETCAEALDHLYRMACHPTAHPAAAAVP